MVACEDCLRKDFTEDILNNLLNGVRSINVYGNPRDGASRLLEDIKNSISKNAKVFIINIKNYKYDYSGFIKNLLEQCGLNGGTPETLDQVIEYFKDFNDKIILMFDKLDAIFNSEDNDRKYDITFFNCLNSLKNTPNTNIESQVSFLCTTEKTYSAYVFYDNEQSVSSPLECAIKRQLTALTYLDIEKELQRKSTFNTVERSILSKKIEAHDDPYDFMSFILNNPITPNRDIKEKIEEWRESYEDSIGQTLEKKANKLAKNIIRFGKILGFDKLIPFITNIKNIFAR
ncbi:MAG: hypothetical protein L3V56_04080 [Candidatus Magnetoovum sp. WYHC-5]|nr:hypothetical protein [Candidatus Magnetoovum sp. WYHC-5]